MRTLPDALRFGLAATVSASVRRRFLSCLWELTYRCNARCAICSYWRNPSDPRQELGLDEIAQGLVRLHRGGCRMINFTGGEPTLRSDLEGIIRRASQMGFWTSIVTNGSTLTRNRICELKKCGLDNLFISLDSLDPETHDARRGIPGLHRKVLQCLEWLREDFLAGHRTGGIFCVLTAGNTKEIPEMLKIAEGAGVFAIVQPYHSAKTGDHAHSPLANDDLRTLLATLRARHHCLLSSQGYLDGVCDFLSGQRLPACNAGTKYFSIDPFGFLHPCVDQPAVGHVLRDDLSVLRTEQIRKMTSNCEGCWYCFRGEVDTSLTVTGYAGRVAVVSRVLRANRRRHWRKHLGRRERAGQRAAGTLPTE